jgi:hypothetical protein
MNPDDLKGEGVAEKCIGAVYEMYVKGQNTKSALELWNEALDSLQEEEENEVPVKTVMKIKKPMGKPLTEVFKAQDEKDALQTQVKAKILKHRETGALMVRCIDDIGAQGTLTVGKVYEAKPSFQGESELYELTGDDGVTNGFYKMRFEVVKEEKQEQNQITEVVYEKVDWTDEQW